MLLADTCLRLERIEAAREEKACFLASLRGGCREAGTPAAWQAESPLSSELKDGLV